ncbi:penicillin acylase family protein [Mobilicoccus pelagius]|uniref:Peptidase S45 family protein n=1 Tax=Mobilicoccus pelagius NBRC 104925 TaxID=1089455 RepID=H5UUE5_9MICO|nr:penicillin acylase family protein [Mobilicoccus pelagius]GAB49353.1 peptidase S45 family protein [Mobilicoccus pelagius NBRC 104925]
MTSRSTRARMAALTGAGSVVLALVAAPAFGASPRPEGKQVPTTHRTVAGLDKTATIDVDRWGVPHISASSTDDAFLAQGFNAARDRLFQIDLSHRRGLGRLSEVFGEKYVEQDRAARLFLYRGDMDAEWAAYGPDSKRIATKFATGVNAYIDWLEQHPDKLPPEFRALGYTPDRWKPEDVVRIRTHALVSGLDDEVARAKLACANALDLDDLRMKRQPETTTSVPAGLDPCLPKDVLATYKLATEPVEFSGDVKAPVRFTPAPAGGGADGAEKDGSNNWVVSPRRTATGRPILANDPHRVHQAPSLRYIAHLKAPGMNVIGGGEPALPGISIGHNDTVAFGLTIFGTDAQDLYVYDLNDDGSAYRYQGGWEEIRTETERIPVRGGSVEERQVRFTRHGPIVHIDNKTRKAYAVRSVWTEPGTSAYFASTGYMRARSWPEFLEALKRWGAPGENQVYADVHGNIGWKPGTFAPRRKGYDGLLPVPGDGRYEWNGYVPNDKLPSAYNPRQGWFATANQFNLDPGTAKENVTAYQWTGPERYRRISRVLSRQPRHTLEDSKRLQHDVTSPRAQTVARLTRSLTSDDPTTVAALDLVSGWNGSEPLGSVPATLFEKYWQPRINTAVRDALVPEQQRQLLAEVDWLAVEDLLQHPEKYADRLGADPAAVRDELLLATLTDAYRAALAELGPVSDDAWGYRGNAVAMEHPLGAMDPRLNVGPFAIPGSRTTPIAAGRASYKQVIDVGNWDASWVMNTPGQSGDPFDKHYRDLAEPWSEGRYVPMLYSPAAIAKHTEERIVLQPKE